MKKKTFLSVLSVTGLSLVGILGIVATNTAMNVNHAETALTWNHYAAVAPTEEAAGNKEYWVCCETHEVVFSAPSEGTVTDASNPDFASVEDATAFNPAYLSKVQTNTFNIGYTKMAKTGAEDEAWEHVEGFNDVVQSVTVADLAKDDFGSNGYNKATADNEGNSCKQGALMFDTNKKEIVLPRFDFTKYEFVKMDYGIDTWNAASLAARFGVETDCDLHAESTQKYGSLKFVVEAGALKVTDTVNSVDTTVTISDADIVNGKKSVVFKTDSVDHYRTIYVNDIFVKTADHVHSDSLTFTQNSGAIGRKTATCSCGEQVKLPADDLEIFTSAHDFGANYAYLGTNEGGSWAADLTEGYPVYCIGNYDGWAKHQPTVKLTKIDFKASGTTVLKFGAKIGNDNKRFTLSYGGSTLFDDGNYGGDATVFVFFKFVYNAQTGNVTLTSSVQDGTTFADVTISDASIINGNSNLEINYVAASAANYANFTLVSAYFGHTHSNLEAVSGGCISHSFNKCGVCGIVEKGELLTSVTLTDKNQYGMNGAAVVDQAYADGSYGMCAAGDVSYSGTGTNAKLMPKVDFTLFNEVVFNVTVDAFNNASLACNIKVNDTLIIGTAESANVKPWGQLIASYDAGTGQLTITGKCSSSRAGTYDNTNCGTTVITDADIINGKASLEVFKDDVMNSGRTVYLRGVTLTAK